ncbi:hypothetical protein HRR83_000501 [Exophiala dermatitidis]|uniref:Uncharacterized protein n=1 Tax=Exophiala dermatitidis TaxID=5970 RepID=A0AAN6F2Y8_EXODE|nr:hypothetical protein HRR74_000502 [Exophiala dermatitidis]KAJ4528383.1 hypothetical protein HRR73_001006 [Exophiala dermatitidis]KAJ4531336.1 hypothetical protein HRR76_008999 [Exophiala dermatitidis]KAJ4558499.1 hypothetical protein HRR77_000502 [Exophiala dermatitidis]KAJ4581465.1 hypothetical protein HRR79_000494 [Exophiala dermatitidis]
MVIRHAPSEQNHYFIFARLPLVYSLYSIRLQGVMLGLGDRLNFEICEMANLNGVNRGRQITSDRAWRLASTLFLESRHLYCHDSESLRLPVKAARQAVKRGRTCRRRTPTNRTA